MLRRRQRRVSDFASIPSPTQHHPLERPNDGLSMPDSRAFPRSLRRHRRPRRSARLCRPRRLGQRELNAERGFRAIRQRADPHPRRRQRPGRHQHGNRCKSRMGEVSLGIFRPDDRGVPAAHRRLLFARASSPRRVLHPAPAAENAGSAMLAERSGRRRQYPHRRSARLQ